MSSPKKVVLLGATGSVGSSAIKVAQQLPDQVELIALAGGSRVESLVEQAKAIGAKHLCIFDESQFDLLKQLAPPGCHLYAGPAGLIELATLTEADMVLVSIVGTHGLFPALEALKAGKQLAVASKEILVMAGEIIMAEAKRQNTTILPVDSEHNAIFQCLTQNRPSSEVNRLILTASGGPFRNLPTDQLSQVTVDQALDHPTWSMGQKISIDSATLFNKGLEMIEARWLFDVPMEKVDVIIHPESIVHSMVEYIDGSVIAQLSTPDMCFPIQYAISWPNRIQGNLKKLDFASLAQLNFEAPRHQDFPALNIAINAGKAAGAAPAMMNAANEVAVSAFLNKLISFPQIWQTVEQVLEQGFQGPANSLDALVDADLQARQLAQQFIKA